MATANSRLQLKIGTPVYPDRPGLYKLGKMLQLMCCAQQITHCTLQVGTVI